MTIHACILGQLHLSHTDDATGNLSVQLVMLTNESATR